MKLALATLAAALTLSSPVTFASDAGTAAIEALGKVNGIALACQQTAISSRARNALVTGAPKTRANGEIFENATNAAYLEQGKGAACPDAATFSSLISAAEKGLQSAFQGAR
jgi:hypothetical protein